MAKKARKITRRKGVKKPTRSEVSAKGWETRRAKVAGVAQQGLTAMPAPDEAANDSRDPNVRLTALDYAASRVVDELTHSNGLQPGAVNSANRGSLVTIIKRHLEEVNSRATAKAAHDEKLRMEGELVADFLNDCVIIDRMDNTKNAPMMLSFSHTQALRRHILRRPPSQR
jgi:hypothetical protein